LEVTVIGSAMSSDRSALFRAEGAESEGESGRFGFLDAASYFIVTATGEFLGIERGGAGEQFIKEDAE
jgi:hypothetical protein